MEPQWTRHGECNNCAACCQFVAFNVPLLMPLRSCGTRERDYYKTRGLRILNHQNNPHVALHGQLWNPCQHHDAQAKACTIYEDRPKWCGEFPTEPGQILRTPCSYWFTNEHGQVVGGEGAPEEIKAQYGRPNPVQVP